MSAAISRDPSQVFSSSSRLTHLLRKQCRGCIEWNGLVLFLVYSRLGFAHFSPDGHWEGKIEVVGGFHQGHCSNPDRR